MKILILSLVFGLVSQTAMAIPPPTLGVGVYDANEDLVKSRIVETYQNILKNSVGFNALKNKVKELEKSVEGTGVVATPNEQDMFLIYSGKGSATSYSFTYIVGVPVAMSGTGLIRSYQAYIHVNVSINYDKNETFINFNNLVKWTAAN